MKNLILIVLSFIFVSLHAQVVVNYSTHAPLHGDEAHFFEVNFIVPGEGGENMLWDYSTFNKQKKTVLSQHQSASAKSNDLMPINPNIVLHEDGAFHYFDLNSSAYSLLGVTTEDYELFYEKPVKRMVYPFSYNDFISGEVKSSAVFRQNYNIDIIGNYTLKADAYGVVMLPGNIMKKVLRVKQTTNTVQFSKCHVIEVQTQRYVWYAADEKFPLISTIITERQFANGETERSEKTFINERVYHCKDERVYHNDDYPLTTSVFEGESGFLNYSVFPNPFNDDIKINYELAEKTNMHIGIYDVTGKRVYDLVSNEKQPQGVYSYRLNASDISLTPGIYFIKFEFDNNVITEKIIRTQ